MTPVGEPRSSLSLGNTRATGGWSTSGHSALRCSLFSTSRPPLKCAKLAEILRRAKSLPVPESTVDAAIDQLRTEFLPIADDDALWLAEIARTHRAALEKADKLPDLARFFDTHLALCYRNGHEWYDIHPLIYEHIMTQAQEAQQRAKPAEDTP